MKKNFKTMAATGMMVLTIAASAMPTLADVNVYSGSSFTSNGSVLGDVIIDRNDGGITVDGGNVSVVKADEINVINSCIDTLIDSGITTINVMGRNIDITNLDATNIHDSMIVTVLKQKAAIINAQEKVKGLRKGW